MNTEAIKALRLRRQRLSAPAQTREEYEALFRRMQPVPPYYFSCPGDPPTLAHRAAFDDRAHNNELRAGRTIVKGRFLGGTVGYVFADEMELYITAFKKELPNLTERQRRILELLRHEGPLTCGHIKEETGLLAKEIMPELHKLQEAWLVYEDQVDGDWDRGWYVFEREWEGVDIGRYDRIDAIARLLKNFLRLNVFASLESMKGWLRLPARDIRAAVAALEAEGAVRAAEAGGEEGWLLAEDAVLLEGTPALPVEPSAFLLHRADFLVRSQEHVLKERFAGLEVLQYILIDGDFQGAAVGHWRQGPHDVEDIVLTLPRGQRQARRREILEAVAWGYSPPYSFIRRYDGEEIVAAWG